MEARNITIVSTSNQNKYVVNTDATTLAELKAALRQQNIAYEGMTFYEGLSHTELLTDESVLPHDVPYKGSTTNELVFMLTVPNKKIRSGANLPETRQALYDAIVELGLQEAVVAKYGKNFTQCKNSELMAIVEEAQEAIAAAPQANMENIEKAIDLLVSILEDETLIDNRQAESVRAVLAGGEVKETSPYSDDELSDMFKFLNN